MSYLEQGCGEKKKVGGTREIFSKVKGVFKKFLNLIGCIYKILKVGDVKLYFSI
jgi:hypothetical protein